MEQLKFSLGFNEKADFNLYEEYWNDYGYFTTYKIYASPKLTNEKDVYIGYINIMEKGQKEGSKWLQLEIGKGAIFDELPPSFYSMATNITMYEQLSKLLPPQQWLNFIEALHLIMGKDKYYEQVKKDRCFHTSLLRNVRSFEECEEELIKAQIIMTSNLDINK